MTLNHQPPTLNQPIGAADLARLFGLSMVRAHAWLRQLPHINVGRARYTRAEWLAQWEAAHLKNPPLTKSFDPLEMAVAERAAWAVGELVKQGKLRLGPEKFTEANEGNEGTHHGKQQCVSVDVGRTPQGVNGVGTIRRTDEPDRACA